MLLFHLDCDLQPKFFRPLLTRCFGSCTIEVLRQVFTIWTIFRSWDPRDPGSDECENNLEEALDTCRILGVPVAPQKLVSPTTKLTFLGIEIDTVLSLLRLPADKLTRLRGMLTEWSKWWGCTKRELLSLIGSLHHAATVVKPGRIFLRRLIDLSKVPKALHHFVRLNPEARSDIQWWQAFACRWNGVGLLSELGQSIPSVLDKVGRLWRLGVRCPLWRCVVTAAVGG